MADDPASVSAKQPQQSSVTVQAGSSLDVIEAFTAALSRHSGNSRELEDTPIGGSHSSTVDLPRLHRDESSPVEFLSCSDEEAEVKQPRAQAPLSATSAATSTSISSSSSSSDSDGEEWGTFRGGELELPCCDESDDSSYIGMQDGDLFVPEPVFELSALRQKPPVPYLKKEDIPIGSIVWIVDEDDVAMHMQSYYSASYPPICNGRLSGVVQRHSGTMTLVHFRDVDSDLELTLCLPTVCLSLDRIEPYESTPRHGDSLRIGAGCYGMLGPRAVGRGNDTSNDPIVVVQHRLYEAIPVMNYDKLKGTPLEHCCDLFFQGAFEKALEAADDCLKTGSCPAIEAHLLRSRILVFLERFDEALEVAQTCVQLEPHWLRGFLSVARAHCGLGQFVEASAATARASMMLPYSAEVERIKELNSFMNRVQQLLKRESKQVYIILDGFYRKRLRVECAKMERTVLCRESVPIVAMHSVFTHLPPVNRCPVCFRDTRNIGVTVAAPSERVSPPLSAGGASPSPLPQGMGRPDTIATVLPVSAGVSSDPRPYCSSECSGRATLFTNLEHKYREVIDRVRSLILSKGAVTLNVLPLEMAFMAVRLFLMVITTHRRLSVKRRLEDSNRRAGESGVLRAAVDAVGGVSVFDTEISVEKTTSCTASASPAVSVVPVDMALLRLGVFPAVTEPMRGNRLDELKRLYDTLTVEFRAEDLQIYSYELFVQLYMYVSAYFTPVEVDPLDHSDTDDGLHRHQTLFFLPSLVGCIENSKTVSYTTGGGREGDLGAKCILPQPYLNVSSGEKTSSSGSKNLSPNCTVVVSSSGPHLLELITVAPVEPSQKLRCIPVAISLNSDVA